MRRMISIVVLVSVMSTMGFGETKSVQGCGRVNMVSNNGEANARMTLWTWKSTLSDVRRTTSDEALPWKGGLAVLDAGEESNTGVLGVSDIGALGEELDMKNASEERS